jgi:hypothetical protein
MRRILVFSFLLPLFLVSCAPQLASGLQLHVDVPKEKVLTRPNYMRGIYISNAVARDEKLLTGFIEKAKLHELNTFVIDVQKKMVSKEHVQKVIDAGIYPVARVVVFEGGLETVDLPESLAQKILAAIADSASQGFKEVQLDYIRYADSVAMQKLSLKRKYAELGEFLSLARAQADVSGVVLSADLFGRITINQHDHLGQKLENFAEHVHALYPMVYPSHYLNDKERISSPYETVKEGISSAVGRLPQTKVVAYIQGFKISVKPSGLSFPAYIHAQMKAVKDASGAGWIIWNARNDYSASWEAIALAKKDGNF